MNEENNDGQAKENVVDVFGQERTPDGAPVEAPAPAAKPEGDDKGGEKGKEGEGKGGDATDIENHPVVKGLKEQVEKLTEDKGSMGKSLSDMRGIIDDLKSGKLKPEEGAKPLFTDIKRVKDLPQEDQDAMTDAEKRLFDDAADLKETINRINAEKQQETTERKQQEETQTTEALAKVNSTAQSEAKRLASGDVNLANQILANFNEYAGNEKLTEEQVKERVAKAARSIEGYTPPKEQENKRGNAVEGAAKTDPHGVDAAIKQAKSKQEGTYDL